LIHPMEQVQFYTLMGRDFANAGRISTSIKRHLKNKNYPQTLIQRVAIVTYEAEINITCYAHFGYVFVFYMKDHVKIVIKDRGQGIEDIDQAMQEGYSTASEEIRKLGFGAGMGLSNIKKNTDVLHIHSAAGVGTRLELDLYTNPDNRRRHMGMTFKDICEKTGFEILTDNADLMKVVTAGYVGDMLSDVNANAKEGNVWVTVLAHANAIAVAALKDISGMIISGGRRPGKDFIDRANEDGIPVLFTDMSSYEVAVMLASLGVPGNP
jgi:serine/threonine-protein kinase RsbT